MAGGSSSRSPGTGGTSPGTAHHGDSSPSSDAPRIGMIWAQARGGVIGADGVMPWHLPEDLTHFKRTTKGSPVVMGRRTWESFPPRFRPLPGRTNIVITSDDTFDDAGALRVRDLTGALDLARQALTAGGPAADDTAEVGAPSVSGAVGAPSVSGAPGSAATDEAEPTIWVIGGGRVYREAMDRADLLVVTEIDLEVDGDTTAPAIPPAFSSATADPVSGWHESSRGVRYRVLTYTR